MGLRLIITTVSPLPRPTHFQLKIIRHKIWQHLFHRLKFNFASHLHIPLIHIAALVTNLIRESNIHQERYGSAPFVELPEAQHWPLWLLYLVYFIVLVILYVACRWYANYKMGHPEKKWLKYV